MTLENLQLFSSRSELKKFSYLSRFHPCFHFHLHSPDPSLLFSPGLSACPPSLSHDTLLCHRLESPLSFRLCYPLAPFRRYVQYETRFFSEAVPPTHCRAGLTPAFAPLLISKAGRWPANLRVAVIPRPSSLRKHRWGHSRGPMERMA